MTDSNRPTINFKNPPVAERALSVQFKSIPQLKSANLVTLWQKKYKDQFPEIQENVMLGVAEEKFGKDAIMGESPKIVTGTSPMPLRYWFLNTDQTKLIQVQHDRFIYNWRKQAEEIQDCRYDKVRDSFTEQLGKLTEYLSENNMELLSPSLCELTYVNHIRSGERWEEHGDLHKILSWSAKPEFKYLPKLENADLKFRYVMKIDNEPVGRLHLSVTPKYLEEGGKLIPYYLLQLTARGAPRKPDQEGILQFLDLAHEWIVNGFVDITSSDMHAVWGKE